MIKNLFIILGLFGLAFTASAQVSDTYIVRMLVGTDVTSPTQPTITSVVPQSASQIDVVWSAASDNVYVSGYRVFRDGIFIATTTLTNFIDTGLTSSTTYSYTVDAFDPSFNFSSTSLPVATTTLSIPIPPTPTSTTAEQPNATAVPALRYFSATPTQTDITLAMGSYGPTTYTVRWGRTDAGELGQISTSIFKQDHTSFIPGLEPGTEYVVILYLTNRFGVIKEVARDRVRTLPAIVSDAPLSVTSLVGFVEDGDAVLSWENPSRFDSIRVVRSHLFYPLSPTDGVVVYEGNGESFTDKDIFDERSPYYYSVFVYSGGRSSAPAVIRLDTDKASNQVPTSTGGASGSSGSTSGPVATTTSGFAPGVILLSAENIFITIDALKTISLSQFDSIPAGSQVLVSVPKNAVLPNIKTIILSVTDPADSRLVTRYLLTLNPDRTAYEVQFTIKNIEGLSRWGVEVFDYELAQTKSVERSVEYTSPTAQGDDVMGFYYLAGSLLTLIFFWFILWRRRQREDNR